MKLCNQLSYVRSLSPGKAVFFYKTSSSDFMPLQIEVTKISGQKSGFSEAYGKNASIKNLEPQDLAYRNPHTVDMCYVPPNINELFCRFSLRVEANSLEPTNCNDRKVRQWLSRLAENYKKNSGYDELAKRYTMNLLMGAWLWRNQHTNGTKIEVVTSNGNSYVIDDARLLSWNGRWRDKDKECLDELSKEFSAALSDPSIYWNIDVTATLKTSFCQEVHPSQKFTEKVQQGESSRQYATTIDPKSEQYAVCFQSVKIGAALSFIDDWWNDEGDKRLRVHEYGADKDYLIAQRHPMTKKDFYSLIEKTALFVRYLKRNSLEDKTKISNDIHYVMAVLCKGGMFQRGNK